MEAIGPLEDALRVTATGARTSEELYTGTAHWMPSGRMFGGQIVAQSLMAAQATIEDDRPVHSLHAYFLRPGDTNLPLTYSVDRIHDGRSFSTRRTQAYQDGVPVLSLIASFQRPDDSPGFTVAGPSGLPEPESLPTVRELLAGVPEVEATFWARERPFDLRYISEPVYLQVAPGSEPKQALWLRAKSRLPDDPAVHRAAIAYASDLSILEPILRGLGVPWAAPALRIASLDHALWFHQDARADEWLLYLQDASVAGSSRGLAHGQIFTQAGALVATVAQEGMVRVPRASS